MMTIPSGAIWIVLIYSMCVMFFSAISPMWYIDEPTLRKKLEFGILCATIVLVLTPIVEYIYTLCGNYIQVV